MTENTEGTKGKAGRPSAYSDELADIICARMSEGQSMRTICKDDDMPSLSMVFRWLGDERYERFREQYTRARELRADAMFEEMIDTARAERETNQVTIRETEKGIMRDEKTMDNVPRASLLVDTLKWTLSRMNPKKYGDKLQVDSKTDITHHYNDDDMTMLERYATQQAAIKSRKPKPQEESDG